MLQTERDLGGGLIAGGVAFRIFLWLVPFGLVIAAVLSFWSEHDQGGLERASREFGIGAAAAEAAAEALQAGDRNAALVLVFGLVALGWFTLGAVRALVLAHSLAWQLKPARIRRPLRVIGVFNGLFLLSILLSAGLAWLREQLGTISLLGTVISLVLSTAIVVIAMWLLPRRATRIQELLPGALLVAVGTMLVQVAVVFYFAPRLGRDVRRLRSGGDDARLAVCDQPPRHGGGVPQRDPLVAAARRGEVTMSTERQRATVRQLMPQLKDELAPLVAMPSVWPTESVEARA